MIVRVRQRKLQELLARKNISQNGLGRAAGLTSGYVSQLIQGQRNASPKTRDRILKVLVDVSFDEIFEIHFEKTR